MSQPAVLFPDAAAIVVDHLTNELGEQADLVATAVPDTRPERFVLVRRLGGPRATVVSDEPELGIECWAPTEAEAHDLAQVCRAHLFAMRGTTASGTPIYRINEFAGPANLPDPLSAQPRYVFTVQVHVRGELLPEGS